MPSGEKSSGISNLKRASPLPSTIGLPVLSTPKAVNMCDSMRLVIRATSAGYWLGSAPYAAFIMVSATASSRLVGTTASATSSSVASFSQSEPVSGVNGSDLSIILVPSAFFTFFEANPSLLPSELPAFSTSFTDGVKPSMSRTSLRSSGLTIFFSSTLLESTAVTASANASAGIDCPYCVFTCG